MNHTSTRPAQKLIKRTTVHRGLLVDLLVDQIEIQGAAAVREVVRHPGGVVVLAELDDGKIPFVRQHRYPMDRVMLELPAGKRDPGENPLDGARRELEEETGYRAEYLEPILSFYPTPGFCDELLHLYYTNRLTKTQSNLEHDEHIEVEFYTLEEALELCAQGGIVDGKTLLALYWLHWRRSSPSS